MTLASVIYHSDYLNNCIHPLSAARCSVFLSEDIPMKQYIVVAYPWKCTSDSPNLTGIPPHTVLMSELEEMRILLSAIRVGVKTDLTEVLQEELDKREIGGPAFSQSQAVLEKINQVLDNQLQQRETRQDKNVDMEQAVFVVEEETESPQTNDVLECANTVLAVQHT